MKKKKLKKILKDLQFYIDVHHSRISDLETEVNEYTQDGTLCNILHSTEKTLKIANAKISTLQQQYENLRIHVLNPPHAEYLKAYEEEEE